MQKDPYVRFLRSWFPLILLGVVVALVATNVALQDRVPLYQATSTIQVGRLLDERNPTQNDLAVVERLIPAYEEMAHRDPVLVAVSESLDLSMTADDIRWRILTVPVPQAQLIDIKVVDADPVVAAAIANEVARQVVLQSPEPTLEDTSYAFIQTQLDDLQKKILEAEEDVAEGEAELQTLTSAAQVFETQGRLDLLNAQIDTWQQTYARLLASAEPGHSNIVRIAGEAFPPSQPMSSATGLYYGLAAVVGGGLATLLALGLSTLGRAIGDPREISALTGSFPVVTIPRYKVPAGGVPIALKDPDSVATSAYRILRNTLRARHDGQEHVTLSITSSRPGEGKTTTVANLGIALANSGLSVLLVDANLRNPELDQLLGLDGTTGFADLLLDDVTLDSVRQTTAHPNLRVVGAGTVPALYTDLLSSVKLRSLVSELSRSADVVIFDTPAIFQERESQLLAQHMDGVLVVAEAGRVNGHELEETLDILERAGATVMAIALNKTRESRWSLDRLPWSRESRMRVRAEEHRKRHMRGRRVDQRSADPGQIHSTAD